MGSVFVFVITLYESLGFNAEDLFIETRNIRKLILARPGNIVGRRSNTKTPN